MIRRVVVTPTFAAGLGVVVAAVLAYPMQTVFSYVVPNASGQGGLVCAQAGCTNHSGQGRPYPFGVGDGTLTSPPGSAEPRNGSSGQHAGGGGGGAIAQPRLTYKVTGRWQGGFWGRITITFAGAAPPQWRLRFGYPGRRIQRIKPGGHLAPGGHGALVRSTDYSGAWGPGDRSFTVGVSVRGGPARPGRCRFNGRHCHFASDLAGDLARLDARGAHVQAT